MKVKHDKLDMSRVTDVIIGIVLLTSVNIAMLSNGHAAVFYVGKMGSNSHSCSHAQREATPKLTINAGLDCLVAGDTLVVKAGTYDEKISSYVRKVPSGTSAARVSLQAKLGDMVIIRATGKDLPFELHNVHYFDIKGFVLDGDHLSNGLIKIGSGSTHISITNNEIKNAIYNGVGIFDRGTGYIHISGNKIHNNGHISGKGYGVYNSQANVTVERNDIHHNGYYGVHYYSEDGTMRDGVIRYNLIHDNGVKTVGAGLVVGGERNLVYNNLFWNEPGAAIQVEHSGAQDIRVFNNTIYKVNYNSPFPGAITIARGSKGTIIRNNIINRTSNPISNNGSGTIMSNNFTTDAKFIDAPNGNFRLLAGSPAINSGVDLSSEPGVISEDYLGVSRPQGEKWDIGAFEYR